MPEIILHLPDGNLLHLPEGTSPETMMSAVRQYGDQQAATAQQKAEGDSSILHQLGQGAKEFGHSLLHKSTTEKTPITLGSATADPMGELARFFSPDNLGGLTRDAAIMAATSKIPKVMDTFGPSSATVGRGIEAASKAVPKKILGTDLPAVRESVEGFGKSLQTPERNVPNFDRYMPNSGSAASTSPAAAGSLRGVPYSGLGAGEELPVGDIMPDDVSLLKKQGYTDDMIARIAQAERSQPASIKAIGTEPEAAPTPKPVRRPSTAEQDNIDSHSSYGEGHVLPEALPTELRDAANDGLNFPSRGTYNIETGKLESPSLNGLSKDIQPFSEFSDAVDPIINSAGPDEASSNHEGLGRSRLTNSWKDWVQKRGQSTPGWPFKEIQQ